MTRLVRKPWESSCLLRQLWDDRCTPPARALCSSCEHLPRPCLLSSEEKHGCQRKELIFCGSLFELIETRPPIAQTGLELQTLLPPPSSGITSVCYHDQLQNAMSYVTGAVGQKCRSRKAGDIGDDWEPTGAKRGSAK